MIDAQCTQDKKEGELKGQVREHGRRDASNRENASRLARDGASLL
jgi:hypothetical protein